MKAGAVPLTPEEEDFIRGCCIKDKRKVTLSLVEKMLATIDADRVELARLRRIEERLRTLYANISDRKGLQISRKYLHAVLKSILNYQAILGEEGSQTP